MPGDIYKPVFTTVEVLWRFCEAPPLRSCCESRVGLVKYQEASRKQFSPLLRSCECHVGLVSLSTRRHRQSSFDHCVGSVKLGLAC